MKKQLLLLAVALFATATAVRAQALVQINSSTFPDSNFRNVVKGKDIDKNQDGMLSTAERLAVTDLYVEKKGIQNLKGIEYFTALEILYCYENQLTSLDLSKNSALTELFCYDNKLTSLDVSKNTALTVLSCHYNQLTNLDVSKNTALTMLYCYDNKLTSLDLTNNKALTTLWCYLNQIGHTDMLKLVNSLPTVTDGKFCGISISSSSEKNVLAKSRVEIAKGKGWNVLARDGSSNVEYAGSEDLGIAIDATNFPDANFRTFVAKTSIDKDANGYLSDEEIAAVTQLKVSKKNIASLKGIEFFTALTVLDCENNQLTTLDLSKNTALEELYCYGNQLTSLDVSKNTALKILDLSSNQLKSLDVSKNTALTSLLCYCNQLTSLDVSKNTALTKLSCFGNQLTALDVSKNTALQYLYCFGNQIKEDKMLKLVNSLPTVTEGVFYVIDTKNSNEQNVCTKPQVKIATDKGWKVYDYNGGGSPQEYAGSEGIAINATNFPDANFRTFVAKTSIDKDANGYLSDEEIAAVTKLYVSEKNIASLKGIEFFTALTELDCEDNLLTSLDVSKNTALKYLYCYNNQLTSLDLSKNTALTELNCSVNQLTSLDVSKNTALKYLWCENNQLTSLDVSKNTALISLNFSSNQLKSLDVSKNTALQNLGCGNNQLISLDVSKNTALQYLWCENNQLTSLDVSKNTALISLDFSSNQLKSLDVSKNTALKELYCFSNQIKEDQMQTLVNSLPTVTGGKFYVIDTTSSNEQNVCTKPQVKIATDKGWTVYDYNDGSQKEYAGSEPSAVSSIEVSAEEKDHWYSLDGKRLSGKPTKKGIYVRNGRKVVVK